MAEINSLLPGGKGLWIPIDHGVSDYPVAGLEDIDGLLQKISSADAIIAHKGLVSKYSSKYPNLIAHLSASTRHGGKESSLKVIVGTVEEAVERGAKAVSVQVNMGSYGEGEMIESLGKITTEAHKLQIPVLGMVYPRGENLSVMENDSTNAVAHAIRLGFELGCDVVKTKYTGSIDSFKLATNAAPVPVLVAGGPASDNVRELLTMVKDAMDAGAAGVCMGRQIFSHPNPDLLIVALKKIIHNNSTVDEAMDNSGL